jgi:hypothetical protein
MEPINIFPNERCKSLPFSFVQALHLLCAYAKDKLSVNLLFPEIQLASAMPSSANLPFCKLNFFNRRFYIYFFFG